MLKKWDLLGVEVGLVAEEQDDAGVVQGPRERLGLGVRARGAGLDAGVEELVVPDHLVPAVAQAPLQRLDADEAHQAPRLGRGDLRLGLRLRREPRRRRGEGPRVEEEEIGRGRGSGRRAAGEQEAGGGRAPHGHGGGGGGAGGSGSGSGMAVRPLFRS